jgi:hypothetical protein
MHESPSNWEQIEQMVCVPILLNPIPAQLRRAKIASKTAAKTSMQGRHFFKRQIASPSDPKWNQKAGLGSKLAFESNLTAFSSRF